MTRRPFTALGWLLILGGIASVVGGWVGVQSTPLVPVQLAYLVSGGLLGIALVIVGSGVQGQDDARAIRETVEELRDRFDDLENTVTELAMLGDLPGATPPKEATVAPAAKKSEGDQKSGGDQKSEGDQKSGGGARGRRAATRSRSKVGATQKT